MMFALDVRSSEELTSVPAIAGLFERISRSLIAPW